MRIILLLGCLALYFKYLNSTESLHPCELHKSCESCIRDANLCSWCAMDNFSQTRCKPSTSMNNSGCYENFIKAPISQLRKSNNVQNPDSDYTLDPQQYDIDLRLGEELSFNLKYKERKDYPVDLYFLMDTSFSMKKVREAIATESHEIFKAMNKITKDVHLGLGTFNDKPAWPFFRESLTKDSHSFEHRLSMTNDSEKFKNEINKLQFNGNYDEPESGLDGLSQVITCKNLIGWRDVSRKIILYFANDRYHMSGDGKFAGIIQPYDGKCYTSAKTKIYTKELEMDYPSISIINSLVIEKGVDIIFIIDNRVEHEYVVLKNYIQGSRFVTFEEKNKRLHFREAESDGSTFEIHTLLMNIYKKISSSIWLISNENPERVNLTFEPDCRGSEAIDNHACAIKPGEEKNITAKLKIPKYFGQDSMSIKIGVQGKENENMTLNIKVPNCDCETDKSLIEERSKYCNYHGKKKCGICQCDVNRSGDLCECAVDSADDLASNELMHKCRPPNSNDTKTYCSGRGLCNCGTCTCNPGYDGAYCQCNKNSCVNKCSGHGVCTCGQCYCNPGWEHSLEHNDCSCSTAKCTQVDNKECNGRGKCKCGRCACEPLAPWDARFEQDKHCVVKPCSQCHDRQCVLVTECALCHMNKKAQTDCLPICDYRIQVVVNKTLGNETDREYAICEDVHADIGCYTRFAYQYDVKNYRINLLVQTDKNCAESYYWFGGVALGTVLLGGLLALVAWKVITEVRDRREYAKFMKAQEADDCAPRHNPHYEPAVTFFNNPTFRKNSTRSK